MNSRQKTTTVLTAATTAAAALLTLSSGAVAASPATAGPGQYWSNLRSVLQQDARAMLPLGAPGVLVGVDTAGRDIRVRAGLGNVRERTPVPWDARFRIGSMTKPFVAATVLLLVGEGRLGLDDTVDAWLPGLVRGHGNDGRAITVRQLLQHTSGLPDYVPAMPWLFFEDSFRERRGDTVTARRAVELGVRQPSEFAPGTSWNYSNTNYALAGLVIEAVTGHRWQREVRDRIVRPLGLRDTILPGTRTGVPGPHAIGYEPFLQPGSSLDDPTYGKPIDATRQNASWGGAAGEIISTTDDANRFLRALVGGELLPAAQLEQMQTTVATNEGFRQNWPGARYGLGLMWIPNSCGGSWSHGGDIMGYRTRNGVSADGSRSVVVSLNTDTTIPEPGAKVPEHDMSLELIDHALCGTGS